MSYVFNYLPSWADAAFRLDPKDKLTMRYDSFTNCPCFLVKALGHHHDAEEFEPLTRRMVPVKGTGNRYVRRGHVLYDRGKKEFWEIVGYSPKLVRVITGPLGDPAP